MVITNRASAKGAAIRGTDSSVEEKMIEDIVTSVISSVAVSSLVVWLLREWIGVRLKSSIEHEYNRKLEEIRNEYSKELARLNSALQESIDFKATRFRFVYERKKIAALCDGFGRLAKLEKSLGEYVSYCGAIRGSEREESRKRFAKALDDFEEFFVPNRIFFPGSLSERTTDIKNEMNKMALAFMVSVERPGDLEGSTSHDSGDKWNEANDYVAKELPNQTRN
jgi:hypothetical protein